ncbi:protein-glutamine gamma-glutamyltransferase 2-like [Chanos chanos]|uniref:protein-glutamine gamma-glutamyltransferase n=1 Tax=Chanos chanos TaxID=29144 RepID=A0A6J2UMA1_CHACN|nr:protein-glutamine gamma-glutamyltransferase 2-like [Chanos chanos]
MADQSGVFIGLDLQCQENNHAHHTEEMDIDRLLVRRGQPFTIAVQCRDVAPQPVRHQLALVLHLGKEVVLKVSSSRPARGQWWFSQQAAQSEIMLTLHSPADAPVGLYTMTIVLLSADGRILERTTPEKFYLLFNPWCKADSVYLNDEEQLLEYILNENGTLYQGSWDEITSLPWNFGQFERDVVDICFEVLDNSPAALKNPEKGLARRADPVYVSRTITAMVNANDDRGVVSGRWDGQYGDGVPPTRWTGSVPILRRWSETGAQRVRYGQCWVFSGVACTILRCLGIPTRCVTNFSSAHDTDGNLTVDYLFNERLESVSEGKKDMIWNYHCWVEAWMKREDLPKGYDGWQVLDPTPQERSDGVYCCGPCPVKAVKEGEVGFKYDAPFVFSEVNADIVSWIVHSDGERSRASLNSKIVGRNISTKGVHGDYREDITDQYKYPEGSVKEREIFEKAGRRVVQQNGGSDQLELIIKHAQAVHGTDFDVIVEVHNSGGQDTLAQLTVTSNAVTYNSLHMGECQRKTSNVTVPAQQAHKEVLRLRYDHYGPCVSEHHLIRVMALLKAGTQHVMQEVNIPLSMPKLHIKIIGEMVVSRKVTALISFTNPLPITLKGGLFTVEGAGLTEAQEVPAPEDIGPGQNVTVKFSFKPKRAGLRKLLVDFDSDKLRDVKGEATLRVRRKMHYFISLQAPGNDDCGRREQHLQPAATPLPASAPASPTSKTDITPPQHVSMHVQGYVFVVKGNQADLENLEAQRANVEASAVTRSDQPSNVNQTQSWNPCCTPELGPLPLKKSSPEQDQELELEPAKVVETGIWT